MIVYEAENADSKLPPYRTEPITYPRIKVGDGNTKVNDLPFADEDVSTIFKDSGEVHLTNCLIGAPLRGVTVRAHTNGEPISNFILSMEDNDDIEVTTYQPLYGFSFEEEDKTKTEIYDEIDFFQGYQVFRVGVIESYNGETIPGRYFGSLATGEKVLYEREEPLYVGIYADIRNKVLNLCSTKVNALVNNDHGASMSVSYYTQNASIPMQFSPADYDKTLIIDDNGFVTTRFIPGRSIDTARLSDVEQNAIAAVSGDEFLSGYRILESNNLKGFASWVYNKADVNIGQHLGTVHDMFKQVFSPNKTSYPGIDKYEKLPADLANPYTYAMLLDKSYSGVKNGDMWNHGYRYGLTLDDYKIGDIFCARMRTLFEGVETLNLYYIALYQGNNKFIFYTDFGGDLEKIGPSSIEYADYTRIEEIINAEDEERALYFFVLRPENTAVMDLKEVQKEVNDKIDDTNKKIEEINTRLDTELRDLNIGKITNSEATKISALQETSGLKGQLPSMAVWAYKQAGIDVSPYITSNVNAIATALFYDSYIMKEGDTYYHKMLIPNSCGGTGFTNKGYPSYQLPMSKYKVGDIFCGRYRDDSSNLYIAAIYQGNNTFIMRNNLGTTGTAFVVSFDNINTIYNYQNWLYYYVLRPERIAIEDVIDLQSSVSQKSQVQIITWEDDD